MNKHIVPLTALILTIGWIAYRGFPLNLIVALIGGIVTSFIFRRYL